MMTRGQANFLRANVRSWVGLALVASVALFYGIQIWSAAGNGNPLASALSGSMSEQQTVQALEASD